MGERLIVLVINYVAININDETFISLLGTTTFESRKIDVIQGRTTVKMSLPRYPTRNFLMYYSKE